MFVLYRVPGNGVLKVMEPFCWSTVTLNHFTGKRLTAKVNMSICRQVQYNHKVHKSKQHKFS